MYTLITHDDLLEPIVARIDEDTRDNMPTIRSVWLEDAYNSIAWVSGFRETELTEGTVFTAVQLNEPQPEELPIEGVTALLHRCEMLGTSLYNECRTRQRAETKYRDMCNLYDLERVRIAELEVEVEKYKAALAPFQEANKKQYTELVRLQDLRALDQVSLEHLSKQRVKLEAQVAAQRENVMVGLALCNQASNAGREVCVRYYPSDSFPHQDQPNGCYSVVVAYYDGSRWVYSENDYSGTTLYEALDAAGLIEGQGDE
jgi:hypothetical protein